MKNSLSPQQEKLEQLKQLLPEVFTEGRVDWEKLKLSLGEDINIKNERYVLNWAGKSNAYKVLQEPTSKTLSPDKSESVDFDKTENLFIEGDNLEVLKILLLILRITRVMTLLFTRTVSKKTLKTIKKM